MSKKYGEIRSFWAWFFFGICTIGIGYAIYYYLNFIDLNTHFNRAGLHDRVPSTQVSAVLMAILCILLPGIGSLIAMYQKYSILHEHVKLSRGRRNIPDGISIVLLNLFISPLTLGILAVYFEWKWQDVMNEHILWHTHRSRRRRPPLRTR
ncbi:MAG: hypothetical protein GF308_15385 [Candidatus Heimdallarchaeota archaeon]|nr:hypothetical protein [Candidatus Heimdallarchaeota archaeon]